MIRVQTDLSRNLIAVAISLLVFVACTVRAADSGVVLQYHRISDDGPAVTRTSVEEFTDHLRLIERLGFVVLPLADLVNAVCDPGSEHGSALAITFDDAHISVYEKAWPLLRTAGLPFTVFVNTAAVDESHAGTMSWEQLRELAAQGATLGNHGVDHHHLIRNRSGREESAWRQWVVEQVTRAQQRIDQELGPQPPVFAYPYGEYDLSTTRVLAELGYPAFGQQSGAFDCHSDLQALPRFPVSGSYANSESVELKLATLPFPLSPSRVEPLQSAANNPPELRLQLSGHDAAFDGGAVNCFATGQGPIPVRWDPQQRLLTAQAPQPLPTGRSRYNCTVRNRVQQRYHWFSQPWFIPALDGSWPSEP